jgi:hypothetical protein
MTTYNVTYPDHAELDPITVTAEYYQRDGEWATFKDANNKVILDLKLQHVASIARVEPSRDQTVTVKLKADTTEYIKAMEEAAEATKRLRPRGE